jgi:uncharacterized protein YjbJ (UPF0337 family)
MSAENAGRAGKKARDQAEKLKGKAKERAGRAGGDEEMEAEGKADQSVSDVKQAGRKIRDAFKR